MKSFEQTSTPSLDHREINARLARQGLTLTGWCKRRGFEQSTVWYAIRNGHRGRKSAPAIKRLLTELGL